VFQDTFAIERADDEHSDAEERAVTIGVVDDRLLVVVWTQGGEGTRIISARRAQPHERRRYHNED